MRCTINSDKWEEMGKVYFVHSLATRKWSTAVTLSLEDDEGNITTKVVASHQIEWVDDGN
jgi:mRNA-degrading endonuclease toxin of MazEF toxin-antitoxin module